MTTTAPIGEPQICYGCYGTGYVLPKVVLSWHAHQTRPGFYEYCFMPDCGVPTGRTILSATRENVPVHTGESYEPSNL